MIKNRALSLIDKIIRTINLKIWFNSIAFTMFITLVGCNGKPMTLNTPKADFRNAKAAEQIKFSDTINSEILTALKEIKAFDSLETVQVLNSLKSLVNEANGVKIGSITVTSEISLVKGGNVIDTLNIQLGAKVPSNAEWDSVVVESKGIVYKRESIKPYIQVKTPKPLWYGLVKMCAAIFMFMFTIFIFIKSIKYQPVDGSIYRNLVNFLVTFLKRKK